MFKTSASSYFCIIHSTLGYQVNIYTAMYCIMIVTFVISQIHSFSDVMNSTVGFIIPFQYHYCFDCGDFINSMYYKEYFQSDQGSTSVLQKVSNIVSSSTDFQQIARCAQFSAKWAFAMTWIEAGDRYTSQVRSGSGDTGISIVRTVLIMISTVNVQSIYTSRTK